MRETAIRSIEATDPGRVVPARFDIAAVPGDPPHTIVINDGNLNAYFIESDAGTVVGQAFLNFGDLAPGMAHCTSTAFMSETGSQGESVVHLYDLDDGSELVAGGIQVSGAISAAPFLAPDQRLYFASASGTLYAYDVSDRATPAALWQFVFAAGGGCTVSGLYETPDGNGLILATAKGLIAVSTRGQPALLWTAQPNTDFSATAPLQFGDQLTCVSGPQICHFDLSKDIPAGAAPSPKWTINAPSAVSAGPWYMPFGKVLVGLAGSSFALISVADGFLWQLSLSAGISAARSVFVGDVLICPGANNSVGFYSIYYSWISRGYVTLKRSYTTTLPHAPAAAGAAFLGRAYFADVTGALTAIDISDGSILWTKVFDAAASGTYTAPNPGLRVPTVSGRSQFLMDGPDFFPVLRDLIVAAYNRNAATGTFPAGYPDFLTLMKALGNAGQSGFVLMWDSTLLNNLTRLQDLPKTWLKEYVLNTADENGVTANALAGTPNVAVREDPYQVNTSHAQGRFHYALTTQYNSTHQKIAVASINGSKLALVGGFNIVTPEYYDEQTHPMTAIQNNSFNYHSWHDAALLVDGAAAASVEREFDRRWQRLTGAAPVPTNSSYVKVASWTLKGSSCLDTPDACGGGAITPYVNRTLTGNATPVQAMITSSEYVTAVPQIRDVILENIGAASSYIYLENYAMHDPDLVRALAAKLAAPNGTAKVIVLTPHPTVGDGGGPKAEFFGTRAALVALTLIDGKWSTLTLYNGAFYARADTASVEVVLNAKNAVYGKVILTFASGDWVEAGLADISSIGVSYDSSTRFLPCSPARYLSPANVNPTGNQPFQLCGLDRHFRKIYVHSKLALFDDLVAVIGSANFTVRSQAYDGEMSLAIKDATAVAAMRTRLFQHWGMNGAQSWASDMTSFAQAPAADSVGVVPTAIAPLPSAWPYSSLNFITQYFDPTVLA